MKPSKIYIKIFLSFLLILIVTEILIFALFGIIMGRYFKSEFDHYASAQVMMVKEVIDSKIHTTPDVELSKNEALKDFIRDWAEALGDHEITPCQKPACPIHERSQHKGTHKAPYLGHTEEKPACRPHVLCAHFRCLHQNKGQKRHKGASRDPVDNQTDVHEKPCEAQDKPH